MSTEESLDPPDWESFRSIGHRMVDDMVRHLRTLRDQPAWQPLPDAVARALDEPIPRTGAGLDEVYRQFLADVLPYPNGNLHPRFWGWVQGNGTPVGMLAEMLAAAMNPHLAGFAQAPVLVEERVLAWLAELMGMPAATSGLLVTGGTMANLLGLAVARHAKAGFDVRAEGLQGGDRPRLVVYGSTETHGWAQKSCELLGLGAASLRRIPVDGDYRIDVGALRAAIEADRGAGHRPICIIGTAGTVNTGATDDLSALADLAAAEGLWLHVDGAFGALARLSPRIAPVVAGIERADSLALDLHKWGWLPFEVACVLVRHPELHRAAFALAPSYIAAEGRGVIAGGLTFADRGIDLTRGFRALKVWMSFKTHGVDALGRLVAQNVDQARHLGDLVSRSPELELLAPVALNVVCFRYRSERVPAGALDALNRELLLRIQESGLAVPSATVLNGRYAIRVAIVNHRTRREDLDLLVDAVLAEGRALAAVPQLDDRSS